MIRRWKQWARSLNRQTLALWLAGRDRRTPWYARALALAVAVYALSPIDLIPDPIPLLGYVDDLILLPLGVWLVIKLLPPALWADCQARAEGKADHLKRGGWIAAAMIVLFWALMGAGALWWVFRVSR
jgi:uncharacterized membrane protein YkvA (DUF1232 family)